MPDATFEFGTHPAWRPLTEGNAAGYTFLAIAGVTLIGLTCWTYLGVQKITTRRLVTLIVLRLIALLIAILTTLRPSLSVTDTPKQPSTLLVVLDASESMTIKDESNNQSRFEAMKKYLERCEPVLEALKEEQQVAVHLFRFSKDFDPEKDVYDPASAKADGKRTDFGTMLAKLHDKYQGEAKLRGLVIVSDGADNGILRPALAEAQRYRNIGCPIYTFGVGKDSTRSDQKDLALTGLAADPAPVPIKADLKIKATADAPGYEGAKTKASLYIDDKLVTTKEVRLEKEKGNEIEFDTKAPETAGEVKVKVVLDKLPGEMTDQNNTIETYLTVSKEGVRVLIVYRLHDDIAYLRTALGGDKRFDTIGVVRQTDAPLSEEEAKQFDLAKETYDVIVLGNVSPKRLAALNPKLMDQIERQVKDKGLGLLMLGGLDSFGGAADTPADDRWLGTKVANVLPTNLRIVEQVDDDKIQMLPTAQGLNHFMLKLDSDPKKNKDLWDRLNQKRTQLTGFTPVGSAKPGAIVFATARKENEKEGVPLLVGQEIGKGRTISFGANTLGRSWRKLGLPDNTEGYEVLQRFWKQIILWLAHQDEVEGSVYARPDLRRLAVGGRQTIRFGVRDKRGDEIPNAEIKYQVIAPDEKQDESKAVKAQRDAKGIAVASYDPKQPGEYKVVAWGVGKDPEGKEVKGDALARFLVFPDISDELLRPAANHEFLVALENAANGTALDAVRRIDRLPPFLEEMKNNPVKALDAKPKLYPDWRRSGNPWFLPALLGLFVAVLGCEWALRRMWGMI